MDIREAIANAEKWMPFRASDRVLQDLIQAAKELSPERWKQVPGERRVRQCPQVHQGRMRRKKTPKRSTDVKNCNTLPVIERTGPADRRKVCADFRKNRRSIDNSRGRRKTDTTCWECLPLASTDTEMSEAERRARRAVAAIPGMEFKYVTDEGGAWYSDTILTKREVDAINDLLDRAEHAEEQLAKEKACRQIVTYSRNLIVEQRNSWQNRALEAEKRLADNTAKTD